MKGGPAAQAGVDTTQGVELRSVVGEEAQHEHAGRRVEGALRCGVDRTLDQLHAIGERSAERATGQVEHGRRRIDADETEARLRIRERARIEAAARAHDQHTRVGRRVLAQQDGHHLQHAGVTRHESGRPLLQIGVHEVGSLEVSLEARPGCLFRHRRTSLTRSPGSSRHVTIVVTAKKAVQIAVPAAGRIQPPNGLGSAATTGIAIGTRMGESRTIHRA